MSVRITMTISGFVLLIPKPCSARAFSCYLSKIWMNSSACLKWIFSKSRYKIYRFISQKLLFDLSLEIKEDAKM